MDQTYHDDLVAHAAEEVRAKSPKMRKAVRKYIAGMKASRCFPNNLGGYPGKRPERPLVAPLEPAERFAQLWAAYRAKAKGFMKHGEPRKGAMRVFQPSGYQGALLARTKSEARAQLKKMFGLNTTRGIPFARVEAA